MTKVQEKQAIKLFQKHLTCTDIAEQIGGGVTRAELMRLRSTWKSMQKELAVKEYLASRPPASV